MRDQRIRAGRRGVTPSGAARGGRADPGAVLTAARSGDPSLRLLYLLAGTTQRADAAREEIAGLSARVQSDRLMGLLAERRMLELVGSRLLDHHPQPPARVVSAVRDAVRRTGVQNMLLDRATSAIVGTLADAGIPALPLKGPRLTEAAFGDLGMRQSTDIDLLVPLPALQRAVALLEAQGYHPPTDRVTRERLPHLHFALRQPGAPAVELHWRVHWYETEFSQAMLGRASAGADGVLAAQPTDLAASLLLFLARDGFHGMRLTSAIAGLWQRGATPPEAGALDQVVRDHPALAASLTASATVLERFAGIPASAWLTRPAARGRRLGMATRLANWSSTGEPDQMNAEISLVDGLLAPPAALPAFVRRQVFATEEPRWPLHAVKMLARYGAAAGRMRRPTPSAGI